MPDVRRPHRSTTPDGGYEPGAFFDEMFEAAGDARPHYRALAEELAAMSVEAFEERRRAADAVVPEPGHHLHGLRPGGGDRADLPVRPDPARDPAARSGAGSSAGSIQRVRALNLFLHDVYHGQRILRDGVIPAELVFGARHFRREMVGVDVRPAASTPTSRASTSSATATGEYLVLEDNLRTPSGVELHAREPRRR